MRTLVVGAGLAGLMAARSLREHGHDVVLFDKGRSPGGRLATRRIGDARVDHGAQFFTVRTEQFASHVHQWQQAGVVYEWCRGFASHRAGGDVSGAGDAGDAGDVGGAGDGFPRYAVHGGMNALAKHLARDLDVRCDSMVFSLHRGEGRHPWELKLDDGSMHTADALVVTCPLPQTFSLLVSAEVSMPEELWRTDYDRTLALLAVLDRPSAVPVPGGVQHDPSFTFVGDQQAKGISAVPAVTFHANPEWSEAHWDDDPLTAHDLLVELARPYLGDANIVESQLKRWRFATPRRIWPDAHWSPPDVAGLVVAGDAFAGPRVEGAALSGLSAAASLV